MSVIIIIDMHIPLDPANLCPCPYPTAEPLQVQDDLCQGYSLQQFGFGKDWKQPDGPLIGLF